MHASKPDPQPRRRCVQRWDLAYALWPDVAHIISTYTLLYYIHRGLLFKGSSSNVYYCHMCIPMADP